MQIAFAAHQLQRMHNTPESVISAGGGKGYVNLPEARYVYASYSQW